MEATATASPTSGLLRPSPVTDRDASISHEHDTTTPPLPAEEIVRSDIDTNDIDVDEPATSQNNVAFHTSLSTTPVPNSLRSASEALSQSPAAKLPSARPSSTQPSPTLPSQKLPSVVSTGPSKQPSHLRTTETHRDDQAFTLSLKDTPTQEQSGETSGMPKRFPSPGADYDTEVAGFNRDSSLVADAIQQAGPEAVRKTLRDKWQKCLMGSEFHHAFITNAMMQHANGNVLRCAVQNFGGKMVREARDEIGSHIRQQDIDAMAPAILEKCSDEFLDRALAQRLKTIDARSLINALARAERLGYENSDVLEEKETERVVPAPVAQMQSPPLTQPNGVASMQVQWPLDDPTAPRFELSQPPQPSLLPLPSQPSQPQLAQNTPPTTTDLRCKLCFREFRLESAYEYHVQRQLCTKVWSGTIRGRRFTCEECGAWFTTKNSQQYHLTNAVCRSRRTTTTSPKPSAASTPKSGRDAGSMGGLGSLHDPYSHLNSRRKAQALEEVRQLETSHAAQINEVFKIQDSAQRKAMFDALISDYDTKQGIIKEKYAVRRTHGGIEEERSRMGPKHGFTGSPTGMAGTPSAKRLKTGHLGGPSSVDFALQPLNSPPVNHLSVSQMAPGLSPSIATAATTDPTLSALPSRQLTAESQLSKNSLSSLQRKGYRISSHAESRARAQVPSGSPAQRVGSAAEPVVLSDSSDGTITDEDIPAVLPPKRVF
ncbi:hypothetical protein F4861DRAFT_490192 [Xylaria intraflava]|nr:hypothetical protein F4861DRAFT_490192 [Xylaria intraflava]